jgi:hypothetical protein
MAGAQPGDKKGVEAKKTGDGKERGRVTAGAKAAMGQRPFTIMA